MKISDLFELSLLNLKRKKTRTLLTISNIVFCSFAITIILSINITISDNLTHLINDENNNAAFFHLFFFVVSNFVFSPIFNHKINYKIYLL